MLVDVSKASSAEMLLNGATTKEKPEGASTRTETVLPLRGWGDSNHVTVRHVPKNHARRKKFEANGFRIETLNEVASAIKTCIVALSFQAVFSGTPLLAKVQTADLCEFFVDFWLSPNGKMFYIDFQRRKGDGIVATKHMQEILRAAKEGFDEKSIEKSLLSSRSFKGKGEFLTKLESALVAGSISKPPKFSIIGHVHSLLMAKKLDSRKMGLETLVVVTDLAKTLKSAACMAAAVILAGKAPDASVLDNQKAKDIQNALNLLIKHKEFEGDGERFGASGSDMDIDGVEPFFHKVECTRNRPHYYEEFMSELHYMGLTIFVQALEVAECFLDEFITYQQDFRETYVKDSSLETVLKKCIADVRQPM